MKPTRFLTALALVCIFTANAQQPSKKSGFFAYHISLSDYRLPGAIKDSSFSKAFKQDDWYKPGKMSFGFGAGYWKGLTNKVDVSGNFTGTFSNFPANFVKDDSIGQAGFSMQLDALLHLRAFKETSPVNPFLTAGAGVGYFPGKVAIYAPLGTGLQFRFNEGTYLFLQAQWRKKLSNGINNDYLHYSISFAQHHPFQKKKPEPVVVVPEPVLPPDTDGDGFADANDRCPNEKGSLNGCPDADSDGIADKDDQCPNEKGKLNGCPDTDNDGIADKDDKCKDVAGLSRYNGCLIPDTDEDGVNDEEDKCPTIAGSLTNDGCPQVKEEIRKKIEFAAKNIFFEFASDKILKKSIPSLQEVATVLNENPLLKLSIDAHADNLGSQEGNLLWSERRAKAVAEFFIGKGIAAGRITYKGYADTKPIADNNTAKGRAMNRRVEMKVEY